MSVILDKGVLDAILPPEQVDKDEVEEHADVVAMFNEVVRVLSFGGRYIVVSLAQLHVLRNFLAFFSKQGTGNNFMIRVQKIEQKTTLGAFHMPVFLLIATKLRVALPSNIFELAKSLEGKPERFDDISGLHNGVAAMQEFACFCHACETWLEHEINITMMDINGKPRYQIWIVDDPDKKSFTSYASFIVPLGREYEWMYSTEKGRLALRRECGKSRLAIVLFFREQIYESLTAVQGELSELILSFAPPSLRDHPIEFLSLGEVNVLKTRECGNSKISGKWTVEDVEVGGVRYRRLVFLSSSSVVQSEAKLIKSKKRKWVVDLDTLTCDHHEAMLTAFAFLPQRNLLDSSRGAQLKVAVLGLGGGLLASFLYRHFPTGTIVAVELDPDVVQIALRWFSLPDSDGRFTVLVQDALRFLNDMKGKAVIPFDIIFLDLAAADHEPGLSCPPREFLTSTALNAMYDILNANGVLALNLVARDDEILIASKNAVRSVFPRIYVHLSEEDVNQVLICPKGEVSLEQALDGIRVNKNQSWLTQLVTDLSSLTLDH
ncbi:unnamed protein product [Toxocara canis]|uniref:PABS domain-containing protein n=1 Tax=Toxocara canis TaxID=6265 RepID=A0A183V5Y8_TOXCA|nr:unnamed protein product [Toxocara canis]